MEKNHVSSISFIDKYNTQYYTVNKQIAFVLNRLKQSSKGVFKNGAVLTGLAVTPSFPGHRCLYIRHVIDIPFQVKCQHSQKH